MHDHHLGKGSNKLSNSPSQSDGILGLFLLFLCVGGLGVCSVLEGTARYAGFTSSSGGRLRPRAEAFLARRALYAV